MIEHNIDRHVMAMESVVRSNLEKLTELEVDIDVRGVGLAFAVDFNDSDLARRVVARSIENGLMLFNPVGKSGTVIKVVPPLIIRRNFLEEGLKIFIRSIYEVFDIKSPESLVLV